MAGSLNFSLIGVLASLLDPLADAGIGFFVLPTFDTNYLLVKKSGLPAGDGRAAGAGHAIRG